MHESYATIWEAVADAIPGAPAAVQGDHRVTWRHFDDRASRLAAALTAAGVDRGTHVALYMFNCPEYAESVFACLKLRAVPANVNFRYGPAELEQLLANADAEVLVYHRALSDRVASVLPLLPKLHTLVEIDDGEDIARVDGALGYEHVIATYEPAPRVARSGDDHLLWYTGGTTGLPKGVIWQQGTLLTYGLAYGCALLGHAVPQTVDEVAQAARDFVARRTPLVTLLTTPMVHATRGIPAARHPRARRHHRPPPPRSGRRRRDLRSDRARAGRGALRGRRRRAAPHGRRVGGRRRPTGAPYDISSLLRVHSSGAMVQPPTKDALHTRGSMSFYDSLGASEGVGFGLALTTERGESASGRFELGVNARVLDGDGKDVVPGSGEPGVLAVAVSTGVGYYNDPARSAATFRTIDGTRYAVPGDWALLHDDGTITLLGRGSGCINTGGEKVWPEEVEESLKGHPAVVDALVVGMPDHDWGEVVAAVVGHRPRCQDRPRPAR